MTAWSAPLTVLAGHSYDDIRLEGLDGGVQVRLVGQRVGKGLLEIRQVCGLGVKRCQSVGSRRHISMIGATEVLTSGGLVAQLSSHTTRVLSAQVHHAYVTALLS